MPPRLLLALLLGALAFVLGACGGGEEVAPVPETVETVATTTETEGGETETAGETNPGVTDPGETEPGQTKSGGGAGGAAGSGDAAAGTAVWTQAGCGGCHTLDAAGSQGQIGPNLDEASPEFELVVERVTNGMGVMPSFKGDLTEKQIQNVAAYVVESTGG